MILGVVLCIVIWGGKGDKVSFFALYYFWTTSCSSDGAFSVISFPRAVLLWPWIVIFADYQTSNFSRIILNIFYNSFYTIVQPSTLSDQEIIAKVLVNKTSHLNNSDFLIRLLYKYSYYCVWVCVFVCVLNFACFVITVWFAICQTFY